MTEFILAQLPYLVSLAVVLAAVVLAAGRTGGSREREWVRVRVQVERRRRSRE